MDALPQLLVLANRLPFPLEDGWKVRTFHVIRALAQCGGCTLLCFHREQDSAEVPAAGVALGRNLRLITVPPRPQHVGIRRIRAADLLLLLAQRQPLQVPGKLEYLGTRRPILAFSVRAGETARMLKQAGVHYISDSDEPEQVRAVALQAVQGRAPAPTPEADQVLQQWTSERQLALLLNARARIGP